MININLDITILSVSVLISLYNAVVNLFRRFRLPENKLLVLFNLFFLASVLLLLYPGFLKTENLLKFGRYSLNLLIITHLIFFYIILLFPKWENRKAIPLYLLFSLPSLFIIALTQFTDKILSAVVFEGMIVNQYGKLIFIYLGVYAFYFISIIIAAVFKSKKVEQTLLKFELFPMFFFLSLVMIFFIAAYVIIPAFYSNYKLAATGLAVYGIGISFVLNHALMYQRFLDFRKLFLKAFLRIMIISLLFIPIYLYFNEITALSYIWGRQAFILISVAFSFLCLILFILIKNLTDRIANLKNKSMTDAFDEAFGKISDLSGMRKQRADWKSLYSKSIDEVCGLFNIGKALFFQLNEESGIFKLVHLYNETRSIADLAGNNEIVVSLRKYKQIIDKSFLYTDSELGEYGNMLVFFIENEYSTALPVFVSNDLTGILLLGKADIKKHYIDFISFLEEYRIKLSDLLENLVFSEDIRRAQVVKRDRIVVKNIKKHIIPAGLKNIEGLKVSTLFINNSDFGGDYFNSININEEKLGILLANTSDAGIESAMLSLQINSVFQSQAELLTSPEGMLNVLNQVLCTSQFTEKYATSLYLLYNNSSRKITYANAAFNPLIIFDPRKDSFVEFDAEGVPVGIDIDFRYKHRSINAPYDGIGICFSPGLSAALDMNGNNYSINKIKDIVRKNKNDTPSILIRKIYNDFKNFSGIKLFNDVTIVIFKTA